MQIMRGRDQMDQDDILPYMQDLMDRIVRFEVTTSIMWMICGFLHFATIPPWIKVIRYAHKEALEDKYSMWDFARLVLIVLMILTMICGLCAVLSQVYDIIQCSILPEAVILKYIRSVQ